MVVAIVEVGEELEQPKEDHACEAQQHIVHDKVMDMVGAEGNVTVMKTTGGDTAA